ncbi:hypothetical protein HYH03_000931 [Edaphochlamys debaryana]|uniref:Uncharacterized protein n=1 Tax=Edaphochlamys debaryana TaxID=47281 RepID=A0A835YH51_9CHLO|nr:hypothetical protein HYH03_000931 [Edaphochlamys debaryana]|eukprot:KAG2501113.1 hypothetical protein HYH03_000931 [Edaphochlamys debaryana]
MAWELHEMLLTAARRGVQITTICDIRNELVRQRHKKQELRYLDALRALQQESSTFSVASQVVAFFKFEDPMLVAAHELYMRSLLGQVLRIDACFKPTKHIRAADGSRAYGGTVSVMNERNQIIAQYHTGGGGGLLELEEPLQRLAARIKAANGTVAVIYVDNSATTGAILQRLFPGALIKEDLFHVIARVGDTLPDAHSLKRLFILSLSAALRPRLESDVLLLKQMFPAAAPTDQNCRSVIPEPRVLEAAVSKVVAEYKSKALSASSAQPLFTKETNDVLEGVMKLIRQGRISNPPGMVMHVNVQTDPTKEPEWKVLRGTSQLEGFHKHFNGCITAPNTGVELADVLVTLFTGGWNRDMSFDHGDKSYGMYDYAVLEDVNRAAEVLGMTLPYPETRVTVTGPEEAFCFKWTDLKAGALPAALAAEAAAQGVVGDGAGPSGAGQTKSYYQLIKTSTHPAAIRLASLGRVLESFKPCVAGDGADLLSAAIIQFCEHGWWVKNPPNDLPPTCESGVMIARLPVVTMLGPQGFVALPPPGQALRGAVVDEGPSLVGPASQGASSLAVPSLDARAFYGSTTPPAPLDRSGRPAGSWGGGGSGPGSTLTQGLGGQNAAAAAQTPLLPPQGFMLGLPGYAAGPSGGGGSGPGSTLTQGLGGQSAAAAAQTPLLPPQGFMLGLPGYTAGPSGGGGSGPGSTLTQGLGGVAADEDEADVDGIIAAHLAAAADRSNQGGLTTGEGPGQAGAGR